MLTVTQQPDLIPESLEAMADAILRAAEREIPELRLGASRGEIHAAAATARVAGCVLVWPSAEHPAQLIPISVWEHAKDLTEQARLIRLRRMHDRVMQSLPTTAPRPRRAVG